MQFAPEDDQRFWFYNSMHFPEPMSRLRLVTGEAAYCALGAANTRVHCLPTTKGIDERIINGRVYIGGIGVTDPDEIERAHGRVHAARVLLLRELGALYDQWKVKMRALIEDAQELPKPSLPEFEPLEHVRAGRGIASNHCLLDTYQKTLEGYFRMWHHHFEFLLLGYGAYMTFFGFCKKAFPEISDQTIARMVAGMEAEIFRPDDELRRLARRAVRAGRRPRRSRTTSAWRRCCSHCETVGDAGRRMAGGARDLAQSLVQRQRRRWLLPLPPLVERRPVDAVLGAAQLHPAGARPARSIDRPVAKLHRGAQAADRGLPRPAGHRRGSRRLRPDDRAGAPRVPVRRGPQVLLRALVHEPVLQQDPRIRRAAGASTASSRDDEDVFHLTHYELESAIIDLMQSWSAGSPPRGPQHWPAIVAERRAAMGLWAKHDTPPALGPVPDIIDDPAIVMLWGITRESLDAWLNGRSKRWIRTS